MQVIRERMLELDFKGGFIEKILKEYSTKKIDEKIDLLMERRNIQSPAGWLMAALKNDYRGEEQERYDDEEPAEESGNLNSQIPSPPEGEEDKILSTEEARERFKLLREKLMAMNSP